MIDFMGVVRRPERIECACAKVQYLPRSTHNTATNIGVSIAAPGYRVYHIGHTPVNQTVVNEWSLCAGINHPGPPREA